MHLTLSTENYAAIMKEVYSKEKMILSLLLLLPTWSVSTSQLLNHTFDYCSIVWDQ